MHQVLIHEPNKTIRAWLDERERNGLDRKDEVWNGVLHVVPPPSSTHQTFEGALERALRPIVESRGLEVEHGLGVFFGPDMNDYRVPDITIFHGRYMAERGIEARADIVIEVLSPRDKSREKFEFYARCEIGEYWLVDPVTRAIEVYVLTESAYVRQPVGVDGTLEAPRLAVIFEEVAGPRLRITSDSDSVEV